MLINNINILIKKSTTINKDIILQKYRYILKNIINKLIKKVYTNLGNINYPFLR